MPLMSLSSNSNPTRQRRPRWVLEVSIGRRGPSTLQLNQNLTLRYNTGGGLVNCGSVLHGQLWVFGGSHVLPQSRDQRPRWIPRTRPTLLTDTEPLYTVHTGLFSPVGPDFSTSIGRLHTRHVTQQRLSQRDWSTAKLACNATFLSSHVHEKRGGAAAILPRASGLVEPPERYLDPGICRRLCHAGIRIIGGSVVALDQEIAPLLECENGDRRCKTLGREHSTGKPPLRPPERHRARRAVAFAGQVR